MLWEEATSMSHCRIAYLTVKAGMTHCEPLFELERSDNGCGQLKIYAKVAR